MHKTIAHATMPILLLAACEAGSDTINDESQFDREAIMRPTDASELDALPESDAPDLPVVATITTHTGSTLSFVDEGDGFVGIAEIGDELAVYQLVEEQDASPLEIFLLYSDASEIPDALYESHAKVVEDQARADAKPRTLTVPRVETGYSEGYPYCGSPSGHLFQWEFESEGWPTDVVAAVDQPFTSCSAGGYNWDLSSSCRFYPGSSLNSKTYLGVCNGPKYTGYDANKYEFRASRLVSGTWTAVHTQQMYASGTILGSRYVYYTTNNQYRYRGNMQDNTVYINDPHWAGAGVAYTVQGGV